MKYLPAFVLATERLILREIDLEDAPFILKMVNDPSYIQNIRDSGVRTIEDAETHIRKKYHPSYQENGFGMSLIEVKATGELVGLAGLVKRDGLDDVDVGFAVLPEYRGMGYASEAAEGLVKYARNTFRIERLVGITASENLASIRVLEKMGMAFERMITLPNETTPIKLYGMAVG